MRTVENISCEDGHGNKLEGLSTGTIIANFDQKIMDAAPKKVYNSSWENDNKPWSCMSGIFCCKVVENVDLTMNIWMFTYKHSDLATMNMLDW